MSGWAWAFLAFWALLRPGKVNIEFSNTIRSVSMLLLDFACVLRCHSRSDHVCGEAEYEYENNAMVYWRRTGTYDMLISPSMLVLEHQNL